MIDLDFECRQEETKVKLALVKMQHSIQAVEDRRPRKEPVTWIIANVDTCQ